VQFIGRFFKIKFFEQAYGFFGQVLFNCKQFWSQVLILLVHFLGCFILERLNILESFLNFNLTTLEFLNRLFNSPQTQFSVCWIPAYLVVQVQWQERGIVALKKKQLKYINRIILNVSNNKIKKTYRIKVLSCGWYD